MVLAAAVAGAFLGYARLGCFGTVLGLVAAGVVMGKLVVRSRYPRWQGSRRGPERSFLRGPFLEPLQPVAGENVLQRLRLP